MKLGSSLRGALKALRHLIISDSFEVGGHRWIYRISEGEYDWVVSLSAAPGDPLYDPFNPFTIYAYKYRIPELDSETYVLLVYPRGCADISCGLIVDSEAGDKDILDSIEYGIAEIVGLLDTDPEGFFEEVESGKMHIMSDAELEEYEKSGYYQPVEPTPDLARRLADTLSRRRFVRLKQIPFAVSKTKR